jgi:hypothetical protein
MWSAISASFCWFRRVSSLFRQSQHCFMRSSLENTLGLKKVRTRQQITQATQFLPWLVYFIHANKSYFYMNKSCFSSNISTRTFAPALQMAPNKKCWEHFVGFTMLALQCWLHYVGFTMLALQCWLYNVVNLILKYKNACTLTNVFIAQTFIFN